MNDQLPFAMIAFRDGFHNEMRSALPDAPVVPEKTRTAGRPRIYRTRVVLASRLARVADVIGPIGWAPPQRAASSR